MVTKCYTISELLCWLNILMSDCDDRVCMMNNILSDFYDYMYGSPLLKVAEWFVGNGIKTMELSNELYKLEWFYGYGDSCANNKCFIEVPNCLDCLCPKLYQIKMEQTLYWLDASKYKLTYSTDDKWIVDFNIPNGIDQWYVVYSITHKPLSSYDETICIDPRLLTWLKLMIKKVIAETNMEINLANHYDQKLSERKARKDKDMWGNLISVITTNVR